MSMSPEQLPQSSDPAASDPIQPQKQAASPPNPPPRADLSDPSVPVADAAVAAKASTEAKVSISENATEAKEEAAMAAIDRHQPIPPPSEPMQYRAIGLVSGRYMPSADQFTQGILLTTDGTVIDAVLLGRIMSLVKNHLSLEQEHLWVVYPRTRQKDGNLHAQIVGVWEPETLARQKSDSATSEGATPLDQSISTADGYFSIRGEVIFQSQDQEYLVVKIRQTARKPTDKPKFFKLKLKGILPSKAVGHFYSMDVRREADALMIVEVEHIGLVSAKPKKPGKPFKKGRPGGGKRFDGPPVSRKPIPQGAVGGPQKRNPSEPIPKPVKRRPPSNQAE